MTSILVRNTEDFEFWGAFVEGHVDLATVTREALGHALREHFGDTYDDDGIDQICEIPVRHFWISDVNPNDTGTDVWAGDETLWFSQAGAPGARPVTGVRGQ